MMVPVWRVIFEKINVTYKLYFYAYQKELFYTIIAPMTTNKNQFRF